MSYDIDPNNLANNFAKYTALPKTVKIKKVVDETRKIKTFFLDTKIWAAPGQFIMVWIPGVDEKPFGLSYIGNDTAITIQPKGKFTKKMLGLSVGDIIGVRGPYGNGFTLKKNACIIAGGCGIIPLAPLAEMIKNCVVIIGAKTSEDLLFIERMRKASELYIATDDGSSGAKGYATDILRKLLKEKTFDVIYTCGPEAMIKSVFDIAEEHGIETQASLERFMKCGFGVCGQCVINGFRVCKDGPVFSSEQLRKMTELGKFARLKSGKKVTVKEYYNWRS